MTAEEIRAIGEIGTRHITVDDRMNFEVMREIAAQLAELNERLKPGNLDVNIYDCSFADSRRAGGPKS